MNSGEILKKNTKIIDILRLEDKVDKSSLATKLGVTWPTISSYVNELIEEKVVLKEGNDIKLNDSYGYFWGISVGSAQTKICLIDMRFHLVERELFYGLISDSEVFSEQKTYMDVQGKPINNYLYSQTASDGNTLIKEINSIFTSIEKIVERYPELNFMGVGIAFTGAVDRVNKRIKKAFNLPYLDETEFEEDILLRNHLDYFSQKQMNISLENNATAAGIAEKWSLYYDKTMSGEVNINQKYQHCKNVITVYLGAGLGLGITQNNTLYRGSNDLGGGVGHLEVPRYQTDMDEMTLDEKCTCGGDNCLEYRIRTDVFKTTVADFKKWDSDCVREYFITNPKQKVIMGKYIGYLINLLNTLLNPDLIIISGKLHKAIDELWEEIQLKRNENNLKYTRTNCAIIKSQLGATAPAIGAAISAYYDCMGIELAWDHL